MTDYPSSGSSRARRLAGTALGLLIPLLMTAVAAGLGYAYALYPIWSHVGKMRETETLGQLIGPNASREVLLDAYFEDSGLDVKSFDGIVWSVRTVMTPFVGYAPAPGRHYNTYVDSHQFRGDRKLEVPKSPGSTRIFLIGASVAFGAGASSDERTIGGYLQSLLDRRQAKTGRQYEVFTFATPTWSSSHERIAIESRVSDFEPDLVIELTGTADCLYGSGGRNARWARGMGDDYYRKLLNVVFRRAAIEHMGDVQEASEESVPPKTVAAGLAKNVRVAAAALSQVGARLHVFLQPAVYTTRKPITPREAGMRPTFGQYYTPDYYRACSQAIGELLAGSDLPGNMKFTNLTTVFDHLPAQEIFLDAFHFGDRGNLAVAQAMVNAIL